MARPEKQGLDYFSHDINSNSDPKIEYIETVYGLTGYAIYFKLLEKIYSNGYWLKWTDRDEIFMVKRYQMDLSVFKSLMTDFFNEGLFDRQLYEKYQILTSQSIQNRYFSAIERRKKVYINKIYLLSEPEIPNKVVIVYINGLNDNINNLNGDINGKNVELNGINADIGTQSKVKESKVKESKERKTFIPPSVNDVKAFFQEKGYKQDIAQKAFDYYSTAGWVDSKGNKVRNWKQKMIAVWFKDENRSKEQPSYPRKTLEELIS
jgi:hypothetical protein